MMLSVCVWRLSRVCCGDSTTVATNAQRTVPLLEVLAYTDEKMFGVLLSVARYRVGMTQAQPSEKTGIPGRHISEMENSKRSIGKTKCP